jgi:hypothetical protein
VSLDFESMTWSCMVCKDERPDAAISVVHRPVAGMEDMFPDARLNLRFCNDRPGCIETAHQPGPFTPVQEET